MQVDKVIITDQDTFASGGLTWDEECVRTVYLAAASSCDAYVGERPDRR